MGFIQVPKSPERPGEHNLSCILQVINQNCMKRERSLYYVV